ncbi:hypothetical protein BBJ28_00000891 [Nothophytophthora sp. Chile5]|nr:hypothetical protein BBJ28_00000891 [Nothophytophthora sp. Chile5]
MHVVMPIRWHWEKHGGFAYKVALLTQSSFLLDAKASTMLPACCHLLASSLLCLLLLSSTTFVLATKAAEEVDVDPDVGKNVMEIVEARGYAVEAHNVTTEDRYVLTTYRLPKTYAETQAGAEAAANKPVVLLQHGLLDSSFTFVCNFRNQSLAFVLADAGYDVWLGNNRGNTWSNHHLDYTTDDDEYWDFSWEDMGLYDLPAQIQYALNKTGRTTLSYIGHSEGTTQAFAGFSANQEIAQKVSFFGALAPVAWTGHTTAQVFVAMANTYLEKWFETLGIAEFSSQNEVVQELLGGYACTLADELCGTAISLIAGASNNLNTTRVAVYISQTPAGTSVKNMGHYAQGIRDDTFASYDYGCSCLKILGLGLCAMSICENKEKYGSFDPPAFPIENMVYPRTGFFIGSADTFATATDIEQIRSGLPSGTIVHELEIEAFSHLDFTWAYNANEKVYQDLLTQIAEYEGMGYAGTAAASVGGGFTMDFVGETAGSNEALVSETTDDDTSSSRSTGADADETNGSDASASETVNDDATSSVGSAGIVMAETLETTVVRPLGCTVRHRQN